MSANQRFCRGCNTLYTPGLTVCPHCGRNDEMNAYAQEIGGAEAGAPPQDQQDGAQPDAEAPEDAKADDGTKAPAKAAQARSARSK